MSKRIKEMSGKKFFRLTVEEFSHTKGSAGHAYFHCICECGNLTIVRGSHIRLGLVKSCGCLGRESARKLLTKYANSEFHKGKGNPQWKGKNASLSSKHQWLIRNFKKEKCEHCGIKNKKLDWALKKGFEYDHKRENFMSLCRSCHMKYDFHPSKIKNASKATKVRWEKYRTNKFR